MIGTALTLSIVTTTGFLIIYLKLPRSVRNFIQKHTLITDGVTLVATYALLGGTLTAMMAGAISGLFVSILLYYAANKEQFGIKVKNLQKI